jgi:hypothetical protein
MKAGHASRWTRPESMRRWFAKEGADGVSLNQVSPCARNHPMVALMPCSHCSHPPLLPPFYIDSILAALCQLLSCTTLYAGDASLSLQRYWCCSSRMLLSMAEMRRSHSALKDTLNTARLNTSESGTAP